MTATLEQRLQALEDIEAIKQLKHRYFLACDNKQPEAIRACFVDGPMTIDYGRVGGFDSADAMVEVYRQLACAEHIVEMHHGQNPVIELLGPEQARGSWGLVYLLIDTRQQRCTQLGGLYQDEYRKVEGQWKISRTAIEMQSTQILDVSEALVRRIFAGRSAPAELDDPSAQAGGE